MRINVFNLLSWQFSGSVMRRKGKEVSMEMKALQTLNSMLSGVPVDMSTLKVPSRPLKLMGIWSGIK
jgi:hypothetical protein